MRRLCRVVTGGFGILYVLALLVFLISVLGLFGQERDPMSAVFLVMLGQPWIGFAEGLPETGRIAALILSPAITLAILWAVSRMIGRSRA